MLKKHYFQDFPISNSAEMNVLLSGFLIFFPYSQTFEVEW